MREIIHNAAVITPKGLLGPGWVGITDGLIDTVASGQPDQELLAAADLIIDGEGGFLSPGFIDLHVHGGDDADFCDRSRENFLRALRVHLLGGTTTIVPTLMSASRDVMENSAANYASIAESWEAFRGIPRLGGLHLEGPYFSPKQLGAQDAAYVRDPDPEEYEDILDRVPEIVRWSGACELPGGMEFGEALSRRGIQACIGHSDATTAQVRQAVRHGYSCVTHLYSSCSMVHRNGPYREGGIVEAAYLLKELDVEMIGDGIHLPPDFLQLIYAIKGPEHIALITDCIRPGGKAMASGTLTYSDEEKKRPVIIRDGVAVMPDNTCFAGSVATMAQVVRACHFAAGLPLWEVVNMASLTPARMLGLDGKTGSIETGKEADLLLLDKELQVRRVILQRGSLPPQMICPANIREVQDESNQ